MKVYAVNIYDFAYKYEEYLSLLPEWRREKTVAVKAEDEKLRSLCAGLLIRKYIGECNIIFNTHGKPLIKGGPYFNISHAGDYAVIGLSKYPMGIDIIFPSIRNPFIVKRICHQNELKYINEKSYYDICRLWTRKESIMKAHGAGLSLSAKSFCVLPEGKNPYIIEKEKYFISTQEYNGHIISLAVKAFPSDFTVKRIYPDELIHLQ